MNYKYLNTVEQLKGVMFVKDIPHDLAVVFLFKSKTTAIIHTFFVRFNLDIGVLNEKSIIAKLYKDVKPFSIILQSCSGFAEAKANTDLLHENMEIGGDINAKNKIT